MKIDNSAVTICQVKEVKVLFSKKERVRERDPSSLAAEDAMVVICLCRYSIFVRPQNMSGFLLPKNGQECLLSSEG